MPKNIKPTPPQQSSLTEMWGAGRKKRKVDQSVPTVLASEGAEEKKVESGEGCDKTTPSSPGTCMQSILTSPTRRAQISSQGITVTKTYSFLYCSESYATLRRILTGHVKRRRVADLDEELASEPFREGKPLSSPQLASRTTVAADAGSHARPPSASIVKGKTKAKAQSAAPQDDDELSSSAAEGEEEQAEEDVLQSEEEATQK